MWRNFLVATAILAIALMLALYSQTAARQGLVRQASISALAALVLAIGVGVKYVPRLARGVDWDWLPFFSHYEITKGGWIYFLTNIVVGFAAINTSNNLLYMVLSALLAVILLSGALSAINFRLLKPSVRLPVRIFARQPFPLAVRLENRKYLFPSFSIAAGPSMKSGLQFRAFYVPFIRAGHQHEQSVHAELPRRGPCTMDKLDLSSRYPFGFFSKGRTYDVTADGICYPEILPLDRMNMGALDILGANHRFERGLGFDLYMIRDYVVSDSARHVDWKATARTGVLKTKEFAAEESRKVVLLFNRRGDPVEAERFEDLVSYAASLAFYMIRDGIEVSLVSDDFQSGFGASDLILDDILRYLALVEMSAAAAEPWTDETVGAIVLSLESFGKSNAGMVLEKVR